MKKDEKDMGELCGIHVCVAENGYKVSCTFECSDSLSARAGWIPSAMNCKDYVEKSKNAVVERVKKILAGDCE